MAMTQWKGLTDGYGTIEMRAGGSSPTVTKGAFVKRDASNNGAIDASDGNECMGISWEASTTANATISIATGGVWKTTGTASESFEPGDQFYIGSNVTISTGSSGEYSQGIVCESTTASGATTLYILLIPSELYRKPAKA